MDIMVIHGPNLNLLGQRKTEIYGNQGLDYINKEILEYGERNGLKIEIHQRNSEGEIIDLLHRAGREFHGVVLNPGAYTHYSHAIGDAVEAINIPVVEVHISNIYSREEFRRKSVVAPYATGQITGFGPFSYILAIEGLRNIGGGKKYGKD
ncbi:type II 3-dehydroquinate dehydratase [Anaerobranca gottschalkii]|uniref:3-dehydroquinate dehydratase n=1 Tax=Anaerobranca gottschalkii DSM 13577 TaxID=1120990 RepID=A0A1H9Y2H9_9FIRM|nr:type II 3-dehydroquinate dehydratase [Anaerobranca gottschalkii]SES63039.1 3-dehydroquinate dehydratase [Anaerobranca gottschalkii DSM 13577]